MPKDKSGKLEINPPKRKKLSSNGSQAPPQEITEITVKKKRKKAEDAPVQISSVTITADDKKQKKDKKRKKKVMPEQTQTKKSELQPSDDAASRCVTLPSCVLKLPESSGCTKETRELEEEEDDDLMGELSPEERRVLERKMKKILKKEEKKRLIADGETMKKVEAAGPSASQLALDYLTCWAENRSVWRFQKTRQTWLLQHMFDSEKIPEEKFPVLLEYLEGLQGAAKDTTVQKALSLVEESGRAPDDSVVQQRACRAREVIQLFS
ncbi:protein cholesin isoform 1-T3 [Menidia menidia]